MRRREFTIVLGSAAVLPLAAWAQSGARIPVIGYLIPGNPEPIFGYFKEGLQKLGYVDGRNIRIEFRSADGKSEHLAGLAAELVRLKVDVLVAAQTPAAIAAKKATVQIPIVMAGTGDPVATGLIASLARPGGNVTGMGGTTADLGAKMLELMREVLPSAKRIAVLANASDPFTKTFLEQIQVAGRSLGLDISPVMVRETSEFNAAFLDMTKRRTDFVIVQPSLQRKLAAELALQHRIPAVSPQGPFPSEGGLMSYAAKSADIQWETAVYVDKILKGARPADMPAQLPKLYELIINLKIAKALGIAIPRSILLRADKIIE